ncbi:MAG TPA: LytTR family DNA-binding domain-containing protein [Gemmatimonadaceae bacterium]|nr:LytTR family DNA-binding domain-containing protein [Gemmatimonadaceae bacterium]
MTSRDGVGASEQPIRVLVVDDEPLVRRRIARLLRTESNLELVAECKGGLSAVEQIRALSPDLVFLDIQMPDLDGFGVIAQVGVEEMPSVVFITAFDQYAIRAFEVHALDYLLKPFDEERLRSALARARAHLRSARPEAFPGEDRLRKLLAEMLGSERNAPSKRTSSFFERVAVKTDGVTRVMQIADVDWFETDGNYVRLHVGKSSFLIRSTATRLQEELDPERFARIHRRYLVNLDRVVGLEPWFGGDAVVVMRDGTKLRLSRNFRESFLARMLGDHTESAERHAEE